MTPLTTLQSLGLSEKESALYLSALELGQETISELARHAQLKRPTAYLILEELKQRGLINTIVKGNRTYYGAEEPQKLLGLIAEKQRALLATLPLLEALNNRRADKPRVRFYEGKEGLLRIYEEMFATKEMRFWGSVAGAAKNVPDIVSWFTKLSLREKPVVYDLLADTPTDREYARRVIRPGYQIRFFPEKDKLEVDSMLAENKISFCTFSPEPHGLIIDSSSIAASFKLLWKLAWQSAEPYRVKKEIA